MSGSGLATPFSLFRLGDTACRPDSATPDLVLQMIARTELPAVSCDLARGRFDVPGVPGAFCVAPAFTDCDYVGEGAFELLILSVPHEAFGSLVAEASNGIASAPDVLHSRAWQAPRCRRSRIARGCRTRR